MRARHTVACVALGLVLTAIAPGSASASNVTVSDTARLISYKAVPGEANRVTVSQDGDSYTIVDPGASIDISAAAARCNRVDTSQVTCAVPASYALKVDVEDLDDSAIVSATTAAKIDGGAGNDSLAGGSGSDKLVGGDGNDHMRGGLGADRYTGDGGSSTGSSAADLVDYSDYSQPVTVTPDGIGDDGAAGELDNVDTDVESAVGGSGDDHLTANAAGGTLSGGPGNDTLKGSGTADALNGGEGADVLNGGEGADSFASGAGSDEVFSRDSVGENVSCGDDADFVTADFMDAVAADCESVQHPDTSVPVGADGSLPPPVVGKTVNVAPVSGVVLLKVPGSNRFRTLGAGKKVRTGSVLDTRRGVVKLTSARARAGGTQTAVFTGSRFQVRQRRAARPSTVLVLRGNELEDCRSAARASSPGVQASRRRRGRRLWGSGRGRFTTRGRHGSATVRGTVWSVEDRCDGTLTTVVRGLVAVRDHARRRTILVRAGAQYLARAPR